MLYAHTPSSPDADDWQPLDEHLRQVSDLCRLFGKPLGLRETAAFLGAVHDIGKASPDFQDYLQRCHDATRGGPPAPPRGPDHKCAGASLAKTVFGPLAIPVIAHHGGLLSPADTKNHLAQHDDRILTESLIGSLLGLTPSQDVIASEAKARCTNEHDSEVFLRVLYSILVDADSLDTEAHTDRETARTRGTVRPSLDALWTAFQEDHATLAAQVSDTGVNVVRREVYDACLRVAEKQPGVYRLTVPTEGGKTRSSLAFALKHALANDLDRIIYAIPYTSIIDQTSQVFRDILGRDAVVEHHSAITPPTTDDPAGGERESLRALAAENWDAPLIITTTVQLFESLFSRKRNACRKVHNIARSVLILDEVQTLPVGLLEPIVGMLRTLVQHYHVTVVLCTATQPALSNPSPLRTAFPDATDIVPDHKRHFDALRRVRYTWDPDQRWTWDDVAAGMRNRRQCLTILNTRKDATSLLDALDDPDVLHLSTLLCGFHRLDVLAQIRARLRDGRTCCVVSTQVIEAGVDVDFPFVMRAEGPLDRIIQAAGRCNREGHLGDRGGEVIIFNPADGGSPPGEYRTAMDLARSYRREHGTALDKPEMISAYFRELYGVVDTDKKHIQNLRKQFLYRDTHDAFRMIPDETVPVLVRYRQREVEDLLGDVRRKGYVTRDDWRRAQPHCVSIRRRDFDAYTCNGCILEVLTDSGLYEWLGGYDAIRGITETDRDPADLIA